MFKDLHAPIEPSPWPPAAGVDLKKFVNRLAPDRPGAKQQATSGQYRRICRLVEAGPVRVQATPAPVVSYLDGTQARCVATRVDHRDVTIAWVAAGSVRGKVALNLEQRLAVVCSVLDEERVRAADSGIPVVALPELTAWGLAMATDSWIDQTRRKLEAHALTTAPRAPGHVVVVDGSLPATSERLDVVGVVKSCLNTDWLADPAMLPEDGGWRSPAFVLPAVLAGERSRLTAFVRLRDAGGSQPWGFSLVRVEVFEEAGLEALDAGAALAVSDRQPLTSPDPRSEIQLGGMYRCEQVLKAHTPHVIRTLR